MARQRYSPSALRDPKVSIVIPVYNEKSTIDEILRRVLDTETRKEVIVVDDCSTDGTRQILENMAARQANGEAFAPAQDGSDPIVLRDLKFCFQTPNQGKGAALRRGFEQVTGDIVLVQDADLEYDPRDYEVLLEPIIDGRADVVYGSRFLGGPQRVHYFWHYVANRMLTLLSDIFTNLKLSDMETCYKVFRREVLTGVQIKSNRFGFEPEITVEFLLASDQDSRITGTARTQFAMDFAAGDALRRIDDFQDGEAAAVADIEGFAGNAVDFLESADMGIGNIEHVDVIADAGSVGSGIIRAEDIDMGQATSGGIENSGNEMSFHAMIFAALPGSSGGVEIAEAHVFESGVESVICKNLF